MLHKQFGVEPLVPVPAHVTQFVLDVVHVAHLLLHVWHIVVVG